MANIIIVKLICLATIVQCIKCNRMLNRTESLSNSKMIALSSNGATTRSRSILSSMDDRLIVHVINNNHHHHHHHQREQVRNQLKLQPIFERLTRALACTDGSTFWNVAEERCTNCTQSCPNGAYVSRHCNRTHDLECQCHKGSYLSPIDRICRPCTDCPIGWGVWRTCRWSRNTVCRKCQPGTYSGAYVGTLGCIPCSKCGPGQEVLTECDGNRDTMCIDPRQRSNYTIHRSFALGSRFLSSENIDSDQETIEYDDDEDDDDVDNIQMMETHKPIALTLLSIVIMVIVVLVIYVACTVDHRSSSSHLKHHLMRLNHSQQKRPTSITINGDTNRIHHVRPMHRHHHHHHQHQHQHPHQHIQPANMNEPIMYTMPSSPYYHQISHISQQSIPQTVMHLYPKVAPGRTMSDVVTVVM